MIDVIAITYNLYPLKYSYSGDTKEPSLQTCTIVLKWCTGFLVTFSSPNKIFTEY